MIGCVATPPTTTAYNERFRGKIDHMLLRTLDTFWDFIIFPTKAVLNSYRSNYFSTFSYLRKNSTTNPEYLGVY